VQTATQTLQIADHDLAGPVLLTIDPTAISVHRVRPEGSPRNSWATTIERLEPLGDRARLLTGEPLALTVEVTRDAIGAMSLHAGEEVWVAVKATEIGVEANG
jgi:molybdate transport system ATP-binding protein